MTNFSAGSNKLSQVKSPNFQNSNSYFDTSVGFDLNQIFKLFCEIKPDFKRFIFKIQTCINGMILIFLKLNLATTLADF